MTRTIFAAFLALSACAAVQADTHRTSAGPVLVAPVVVDLETPWAFAFLPSGDLLITERDGYLMIATPETDIKRRVDGTPDVVASGQGGLLDVVLDPRFADNRVLYLSYSEPADGGARTAVMRAVLDEADARLTDQQVIFRQSPAVRGGRHFGSRIVPDGKGNLWVTLGDRGQRPLAQDMGTQMGKVVRIKDTGGAADGNPFPENPEVWSLGHRNPQGAAMDEAGNLWTVSHGARGGDEVNRPEAGKNYGWPVISYGRHYSGGKIGEGTARDGMEQPKFYWDPSIAPSGMMIYSGKLWPEWTGDIFIGALKFDLISRLDRDGDSIAGEEQLFPGTFGRIRDVREAPDGSIWFLAVGEGALYRMAPDS